MKPLVDFSDLVDTMRQKGVAQAEFHANGKPKSILLGPMPRAEGDAGEDDGLEQKPTHPLRHHAMRIMGKEPMKETG